LRLVIDRLACLSALDSVLPAVPARSPKPVLRNVLLSADGGAATLAATDLELWITASLPGVRPDGGPAAVLLPADRLKQILQRSTDDDLAIEAAGDGQVRVRGQRSQFTLPTEDPDTFPPPAAMAAGRASVGVVGADLALLLRRTAYAADPSSTRYALGGVCLELADTAITGIATDGRRLATQTAHALLGPGAWPSPAPVIPMRACRLWERIAAGAGEAAVELLADRQSAKLLADGVEVWTRLVEGRFPAWRDVMPKSFASTLDGEAGELLDLVRRAAITTSKESRGLDLAIGDGMLVAAAKTADVGESRAEGPFLTSGPDVAITLDAEFLADLLGSLDPALAVRAELDGKAAPVVFRTDDGLTAVIMPLNRE
jgi:DNA polymerase-3 subunit beta